MKYQKPVLSCSTITQDKVRNPKGEDLGEIKDIMLNTENGRVEYAVLSFGGFLNVGNKLFALPWEALMLDEEEECFVLDVDKERLENAPGFDKDDWPDMADPKFRDTIYHHYGYEYRHAA